MSAKSEVSNWKFSTFLENNNNKFNKVETFDKIRKITDWEKKNTLDC